MNEQMQSLLTEIGDTLYDLWQDDALANVYCIDTEKPDGAPLDEAVAKYVQLRHIAESEAADGRD